MPVPVSNLADLQKYVRGVLAAATHHGQNVDQVVLALAGGVISRQAGLLQVRKAPAKGMGLGLTFSTHKGTYVLSYNHTSQQIDLKDGTYQGPVLHSFDNSTPLAQIAGIFANL